MAEVAPELDALVTRLYAGPTPLVWECSEGGAVTFEAKTGVDAGCPFSCLLFCLGLHKVLQAAQAAGPPQTMKAFMDGVYAVCKVQDLFGVIAAFRQAAAQAGLELHDGKIQISAPIVTSCPSISASTTLIA